MKTSHEIVMVTALPCEARSLIEHFHLKKVQESCAFPLYRNENLYLTLVVSGVGVIQAAAATAFAASYFSVKPQGFVNIGIAGSLDISVGSLHLINKVSNEMGNVFYPMNLSHFQIPGMPLITLAQPALASAGNLVDMEAFGFYQTAARFTTLELIHSLKVVSDNQEQGFDQINPKQVKDWIGNHLNTIEIFLNRLNTLITAGFGIHAKEGHLLQVLSKQFHITQYQQYQVKKCIQKILAFELEAEEILLRKQCCSIKQWLVKIQSRIYGYSLGIFNEV